MVIVDFFFFFWVVFVVHVFSSDLSIIDSEQGRLPFTTFG